jgi:hypothetical protein
MENRIKLKTSEQEVRYKGLCFSYTALKKKILASTHVSQLTPYVIKKHFNKETGNIDCKYAWESIFLDMREDGRLATILEEIINEEYLE